MAESHCILVVVKTEPVWECLAKVDGVEQWTCEDLVVLWQRGVYSMAAADTSVRLDRVLAKYPAGFRMVLLVEPNVPAPTDDVRARLSRADAPTQRAFATVSLEGGFRSALVTSVVSGIQMRSNTRTTMRAFTTVSDAATWLGTFSTPNDHEFVEQALTALRAKA